jgi:hypothetical protein
MFEKEEPERCKELVRKEGSYLPYFKSFLGDYELVKDAL